MIETLKNLLARLRPSTVIAANCVELIQREQVGLGKYGVSLTDAPLTHEQVLQHLLEEQLDAANYTRKALMTASTARVDYALLRSAVDRLVEGYTNDQEYEADACPNDAAHESTEHFRDALKQVLLDFDSRKILRDLRSCSSS